MQRRPASFVSVMIAIGATLCALAALRAYGQAQDVVVAVSAESNHRIRFDNGRVRMYEVELPKGKATAFHEHVADSFAVVLNSTSRINEPKDGQRTLGSIKAGQVAFASTAKGPYTHRIEAAGDVPFRVIAMEILSPENPGANGGRALRPAPFVVAAQENSRGRVFRLILKPGDAVGPFERPANTAIFAIVGGRTSEASDGQVPRLWDSEAGSFRWVDSPQRVTIRNEGKSEVELVEIEIF